MDISTSFDSEKDSNDSISSPVKEDSHERPDDDEESDHNKRPKMSNISQDRLEIAKLMFMKYIGTQSIPKDRCVDIIPTTVNLTHKCWKEFKKYGIERGYIVKRRRAKPEEMNGESPKRPKYVIYAIKAGTVHEKITTTSSTLSHKPGLTIETPVHPIPSSHSIASDITSTSSTDGSQSLRPTFSFSNSAPVSYDANVNLSSYSLDSPASTTRSGCYSFPMISMPYVNNYSSPQVSPMYHMSSTGYTFTVPMMSYPTNISTSYAPSQSLFVNQSPAELSANQEIERENQAMAILTSDEYYQV
jgi:hypothetical protein